MSREFARIDETSIHAVKFKLFPHQRLLTYLDGCAVFVSKIASTMKEWLNSTDPDQAELARLCVKSDSKVMAANLAPFFCKKEHSIRAGLEDVEGKTTPVSKLVKRPADRLRKRGILPFPYLEGIPQRKVIQLMFSAFMALRSWQGNEQNLQELRQQLSNDLAQKSKDIDRAKYDQFLSWLSLCESEHYFRLSGRTAFFAERSQFKYRNQEIMAALASMFPDWKQAYGENTLLAHFCTVELKARRLARVREHARWTPPSASTLNLFFVSGGISTFKLGWINDRPTVAVQLDGEMVELAVSGNSMLQNVSISQIAASKYAIKFQRFGTEFSGECNSLTINRKGNEYYVQIAIRFDNLQPVWPYDLETMNELLCYQRTSPVNAEHQPYQMRVLGIDLGLKNLASYAVVERDRADDIAVLTTGVVAGSLTMSTKRKMARLRQLISGLRRSIAGRQRALDVGGELWHPPMAGGRLTNEHKADLQADANHIKDLIKQLKNDRAFNGQPTGHWMQYAALIRDARRVLMKLHMAGYEQEAGVEQPILFPALLHYYNQFRANLLKKLTAMIVQKAREYNVHAVICENLEEFGMDSARSPKDNMMLSLWSHRAIVDSLRRALMVHGIGFDTVDPRHTSQIDPQTGEFAYRGRQNRSRLHVRREGGVVAIDADQAAACNIAKRYLRRGVDVVYIKAAEAGDCLVPVGGSGGAIGPMLQGAIAANVGTQFAKLVKAGDNAFRLVDLAKREYNKMLKKAENKVVGLYRHGDVFVPKEQHHEAVEAIGAAAGVLDMDKAFTSRQFRRRFVRK